ncbi:pyridoxamine 5'-phosphate oxidase family protein [Actinoplanes sp. NPDC051475]|uniref:pyridoxamine 5'-phosphate oxidase family protein n=1 Tax=Actinoplanes sp. NPDC051475 TaxID=3157225 RepID=UPI00344DB119
MPIDWAAVAARLDGARIYWLAVLDRRGAPRTFPRWGVVLNGALYFYVDGATGAALDLWRDPRIAINLEDGENPVLVRGTAKPVGRPTELPEIVAAFSAKYVDADDSRFPNTTPGPADYIYMVTPTWALFTEEAEARAAHQISRLKRDPRVRIWNPKETSATHSLES